jgi:RNase adapter protein RapZ
MSQKQTHLVVITGLSGSGKTVALRALEDFGYYAIDNLPVTLVSSLLKEAQARGLSRVAVSVDARTAGPLTQLRDELSHLSKNALPGEVTPASPVRLSVLYLTATLEAITRRFGETRRPHPLASRLGADASVRLVRLSENELTSPIGEASLDTCMRAEQTLLAPLSEIGRTVDTSHLNAVQLRSRIKDWLDLESTGLSLLVQSFGFKRGVPLDADFVFDARFLANPYYEASLRPMTGRDQPVIDFLTKEPHALAFANSVSDFVKQWAAHFSAEGRVAVGVAIGCTGGQHRSVFVAEKVAQALLNSSIPGISVRVRHRDITV